MEMKKMGLEKTKWAGKQVLFYEAPDSTNNRAIRAAEEGAEHGTLVVAESQTAGKGRRGRSWVSPARANLYFTILLRPQFAPEKASMLTLVMAHSVATAIRQATGLKTGIKWPNDIVVNGKKAVGILTELSAEAGRIRHVVIGVGINVHRQEFPAELADKATSLEAELDAELETEPGAERDAGADSAVSMERDEKREERRNKKRGGLDRKVLLENVMAQFEADYEKFAEAGSLAPLKDSYHAMLVNRGREVCVLDPKGEYRGIAGGITDQGELLVELSDGSINRVYAGEVSVRGVLGYT